ncbi:uncharacterized protein LOC111433537 [Cucurbita moschata]|uniref:Uncharacterized protein LOC111433537 n=1 Tax=Cucurbita moschata TaxID=3662 RepID=A0A6J1EER1_CUCMO|nr:uncharacterized protein LOC111433537 [Cucurbita moschata]XP_022926369.1 uncharacterized protein LOC111433537 [Cucurbita moschata]XP_022926370.1 uncharacterized protein LOC111433537 [Cucurbita moschata]XP_022926371.1 uncharacterized protein LOC111433537 [Cucurbita moschata]
MSATLLSYCNPRLDCNYGRMNTERTAFVHLRPIGRRSNGYRKLTVFSVTEGSAKSSESEETIPSWAKPDSEEPPPWVREEGKETGSQLGFQVPFYVYLLASSITAIAAIGSVFEYVNQKPVFGIINSDSIFYAPLLGFFAFTGIPTAGFLWFKSVEVANKEAEDQDRRDGYL